MTPVVECMEREKRELLRTLALEKQLGKREEDGTTDLKHLTVLCCSTVAVLTCENSS
jgi:hypothetical protein